MFEDDVLDLDDRPIPEFIPSEDHRYMCVTCPFTQIGTFRMHMLPPMCVCIYAGGMHSPTTGHGASASSPQARRRSICGRMVSMRSQDRGPTSTRYILEGKGHCSIASSTCYVYTCVVGVVTLNIDVVWYVCDMMLGVCEDEATDPTPQIGVQQGCGRYTSRLPDRIQL